MSRLIKVANIKGPPGPPGPAGPAGPAGLSGDQEADNLVTEHVLDETPHPAYDDGPSFLLLYQNAKV